MRPFITCLLLQLLVEHAFTAENVIVHPCRSNALLQSLTINGSKISANTETTQLCQTFGLLKPGSSYKSHRLIGWDTVLDSLAKKHFSGWVLYGCTAESASSHRSRLRISGACSITMTWACSSVLAFWSQNGASSNRFCLDANGNAGISQDDFDAVILRVYYSNADRSIDVVPSLTVNLHYVEEEFMHAGQQVGVLSIGPSVFLLPPRTPSISIKTFGFANNCSKSILENAGFLNDQTKQRQRHRIVSAWLRMDKLGISGRISLIRNSTSRINLLVLHNSLGFSSWNPGLEPVIEPGDTVEIYCTFSTEHRQAFTFNGDGASDEACSGFLQVLPLGSVHIDARDTGDISSCAANSEIVAGCNRTGILNLPRAKPLAVVLACGCKDRQYPVAVCSSTCYEFLQSISAFTIPSIRSCFYGSAFHTWMQVGGFASRIVYLAQSQIDQCMSLRLSDAPANGTTCSVEKSTTVQPATKTLLDDLIEPTLLTRRLPLLKSINTFIKDNGDPGTTVANPTKSAAEASRVNILLLSGSVMMPLYCWSTI